jgi:hypothetical protein
MLWNISQMVSTAHPSPIVLDSPSRAWTVAGLGSCLILPSCGIVQKYFGNLGLVFYLLAASAFLWISYRFLSGLFLSRLSERQALYLTVATFVALGVIFAYVYPKANTHVAGYGSDADDALNLAAHQLLQGRYPFYPETYLHNPIGIFPGAVLLSLPFVLLGGSASQNLFWLAAFSFSLSRTRSSWRLSLLLLWTLLLLSPVVMQQLVTGTDDVANSIYVLLFMLLMVRWVPSADAAVSKKILAALILGIGLSSRGNFVLVLPQLFSELTRRANWSVAVKYLALTSAAFAMVTLPFWLYDPAGFSPFHNQANKVAVFQTLLPQAGFIIPALGGCIALALAIQSLRRHRATWLRDCAIVQAFLVFSVVTLSLIQRGTFSLVLIGYGVFFLFFGVIFFGLRMFDMSEVSAQSVNVVSI